MNSEESAKVLERSAALLQSLKAESDRGCVLVVSSLVERALENQISRRLLPKLGREDDLIGRSGNNPISGFSAKINLAYRLGIVTKDERSVYHQLRELRNVCAHHIDQQDFSAQHFKDRTKNIIRESVVLWDVILAHLAPKLFNEDPPTTIDSFVEKIGWRVAFEIFFSMLVAHKEVCIDRVLRVSALFQQKQVSP
jgi:hypothetical protein